MIASEHRNDEALALFPLEGGRAGVGGDTASGKPTNAKVVRARKLRQEATVAERALWPELRKLKRNFRRQVPFGPYVADFAHHESRLIIEVDGYYHTTAEGQARDAERTRRLNEIGYRVIRFDEALVRNDTAAVIARILAEAVSPPSPTLPTSRGKGVRRDWSN